jgi:integrase
MPSTSLNFTIARINKLPLPTAGKRTYYRDTQLRGLILDVRASGTKAFYVYKKLHGKPVRIFIENYDPNRDLEKVRAHAYMVLGQIADGKNPHEEAQRLKNETTLGELYQQYMTRYSKPHKRSWRYDEDEIPRFLGHWFNRRLSSLERGEIQKLHEKVFSNNGLYQANTVLKRLRSMYNKASEWGWEGTNPVVGIKHFKEKSRDRFIQPSEMPWLLRSLHEEANETARDFIWMLLLTGARKTNTLMMRWDQIQWDLREWRIPETKNGDPLNVPLVEQALAILQSRYASSSSAWVFPQEKDHKKHIIYPRSTWRRVLERATLERWSLDERLAPWVTQAIRKAPPASLSSISVYKSVTRQAAKEQVELPRGMTDLRLHDIRRTFGTYQALTGASLQVIGKSLGHKSVETTQIYARLNLDAVRASVERATTTMLQLA